MSICVKCENKNICETPFKGEDIKECNRFVDSTIDWEQRRYEIAKDLFISSYRLADSSYKSALDINYAVELADMLIDKLKRNDKRKGI